ncbi:MAG: hypothetical protein L0Z62_16690, partial [Gemmataceae bacterium]|nr:hypothetical protein [Gemmataceae bacterium]
SGSPTTINGPVVMGPIPLASRPTPTESTGQLLWNSLPQQRVSRATVRSLDTSVESRTPAEPPAAELPAQGSASRPPVLADAVLAVPALVGSILAERDVELQAPASEFFPVNSRTESSIADGGLRMTDSSLIRHPPSAIRNSQSAGSLPVAIAGAVLHGDGTGQHLVRGALDATVFSSFLVPLPPDWVEGSTRTRITRAEEYLARLERLEHAGRRVGTREPSDTSTASARSEAKGERSLFRLAVAWLLLQSAYQIMWPQRLGPGEREASAPR